MLNDYRSSYKALQFLSILLMVVGIGEGLLGILFAILSIAASKPMGSQSAPGIVIIWILVGNVVGGTVLFCLGVAVEAFRELVLNSRAIAERLERNRKEIGEMPSGQSESDAGSGASQAPLRFRVTGRNASGDSFMIVVEAKSAEEARAQLESQGATVTTVRPAHSL